MLFMTLAALASLAQPTPRKPRKQQAISRAGDWQRACTDIAPAVFATTRRLENVPFKFITVRRPTRTILRFHGGPDDPALGAPDDLDCYLVTRFHARLIKPAYFGSTERSPWNNTPNYNAYRPLSYKEVAARMPFAINKAYAGMPQSVREMRRFVERYDSNRTFLIGESHGAVLAALASGAAHRSRVVLLAPVIASQRAIVRAAMMGRYKLRDPIDPPRLVNNGVDVTEKIFATRLDKDRLMEAVSLAYYRPWEDVTLDQLLARNKIKARIIVGLRDRIGMIDLRDWRRFRRSVPPGTQLCADPMLAHEPPMMTKRARRCLGRFMKLS